MMNYLQFIFRKIQLIYILNKKYKLKFMFMFCSIFIFYFIILYKLICLNTINNDSLELLFKDNNLLKFISNTMVFKGFISIFISRWNFGPSIETLLGLSIILFSIILILWLLSWYIKLLFLPLVFIISSVFYSFMTTVKNMYNIENAVVIFDSLGIVLKKKEEFIDPISYPKVSELVDTIFETYKLTFLEEKLIITDMDKCLLDLKLEIFEHKFNNVDDVSLFINQSLKILVKTKEILPVEDTLIESTTSLWTYLSPYITVPNVFIAVVLGTFGLMIYLSCNNLTITQLFYGQNSISENILSQNKSVSDKVDIVKDILVGNNTQTDVLVDSTLRQNNVIKNVIQNIEKVQEESHNILNEKIDLLEKNILNKIQENKEGSVEVLNSIIQDNKYVVKTEINNLLDSSVIQESNIEHLKSCIDAQKEIIDNLLYNVEAHNNIILLLKTTFIKLLDLDVSKPTTQIILETSKEILEEYIRNKKN